MEGRTQQPSPREEGGREVLFGKLKYGSLMQGQVGPKDGLPGIGTHLNMHLCQGQPTLKAFQGQSVLEGFPRASMGRDCLQEGLYLAPVTK